MSREHVCVVALTLVVLASCSESSGSSSASCTSSVIAPTPNATVYFPPQVGVPESFHIVNATVSSDHELVTGLQDGDVAGATNDWKEAMGSGGSVTSSASGARVHLDSPALTMTVSIEKLCNAVGKVGTTVELSGPALQTPHG